MIATMMLSRGSLRIRHTRMDHHTHHQAMAIAEDRGLIPPACTWMVAVAMVATAVMAVPPTSIMVRMDMGTEEAQLLLATSQVTNTQKGKQKQLIGHCVMVMLVPTIELLVQSTSSM